LNFRVFLFLEKMLQIAVLYFCAQILGHWLTLTLAVDKYEALLKPFLKQKVFGSIAQSDGLHLDDHLWVEHKRGPSANFQLTSTRRQLVVNLLENRIEAVQLLTH